MLEFATLVLNIVERVLEAYLHIGLGVVVHRQHGLHTLKVQEIERIGEFIQERLNTLWVDMTFLVEGAVHLHTANRILGDILHRLEVFESDMACVVVLEFLGESHAIHIKHRWLRQMLGTVLPEGTFVWVLAMRRERLLGLGGLLHSLQCHERLIMHLEVFVLYRWSKVNDIE